MIRSPPCSALFPTPTLFRSVHPATGRPAPAADVVPALLEHVRPSLAAAGDEQRVADGVAGVLSWGTGADLQRRVRSEEHTSELQSRQYLVCRLLLEKKKIYV